jgi:hypothetical protein
VKGRLIAFLIALVVLAFAQIRHDVQTPAAEREGNIAAGQLAVPAAPDPAVPAIITAAVSPSATFHTVLVVESGRPVTPMLSVSAAGAHLPVVAHSASKPRSFPLLI